MKQNKQSMFKQGGYGWARWVGILCLSGICASAQGPRVPEKATALASFAPAGVSCEKGNAESGYVVIGWNDLGMHCINQSFKDIAILPPYNNLWVQVIRRGDPPQIVSSGISLEYSIVNNTTVQGKSDFWDYAFDLFGMNLEPGIGLTGNGLSGTLTWAGDHFEATGIPVLPYYDNMKWNPYQVAIVKLKNAKGKTIQQSEVVLPISDELNCAKCHAQGGDATGNLPNGGSASVEANILAVHDYYNGEAGINTTGENLSDHRPVLCARCHGSNALNAPGVPSVKSLSEAMHGWHQPSDVRCSDVGCYDCHPGAKTQCLRTAIAGMGYQDPAQLTCPTCHGPMKQIADSIPAGRRPWMDEPSCEQCHGINYASGIDQTGHPALYRHSTGHGGLYCSACHNSPHAWWPSKQKVDDLQPLCLQKTPASLARCAACHTRPQVGDNPHVQYYLPPSLQF